MKCHYEVLGIPCNASVDDIKKSYRKLALEWHPDKNLHRTEEATETFQLIQQAYDVLIDPQERAWYDRNKDKILRGDEDYVDDHLDVYQYFNTSRFKGYGDDEKSFYTIYREVFEKIAAEDEPFMDDDIAVPSFGLSSSAYKEVVYPFYAHWQSYCTAKTYTWVDKYDLAEARKCGVGRQVIRCMERENKKLREQHKRMRNEEIRQLVAFVRKRDKRIEEYKKHVEKLNAEKAKKAEEQRQKQIAERKKHLENYKESEWTSMSALEHNLTEIEANLDSEFGVEDTSDRGDEDPVSDIDGSSDLYCIACDKAFRSAKAMTNHQNSKKHKENVASLKEFMQDGDVDISYLDESITNGDAHDDALKSSEELDVLETKQNDSKRKKKRKKKLPEQLTDNSDFDVCDLVKCINELETNHQFVVVGASEASAIRTLKTDEGKEDSVLDGNEDVKKSEDYQQKDSRAAHMNLDRVSEKDEKQNCAETDENIVKCSLESNSSNVFNSEAPLSLQQETQGCKPEIEVEEETTKKSKSYHRKNKKKTAINVDEQAQQVTTTCVKCGKIFGSRNKLFDHLKVTGHSMFLSDKDRDTLKLKKKRET